MPLPSQSGLSPLPSQNLESAFWGLEHLNVAEMPLPSQSGCSFRVTFWGFGVSYHNLIRQMQVFKTEQHLKCCSFDASPQSEWLITAHLERIWNQHFGLSTCKSSKRAVLRQSAAFRGWTGRCTAHLERIWSQQFWGFGLPQWFITWFRADVFKTDVAVLMSPVAYHGSFRENLPAFWGFGVNITTWSCKSSKRSI